MEWLETALRAGGPIPEDTLGYLLGRGLQESRIRDLNIVTWTRPATPTNDLAFVKHYGPSGCGEAKDTADLRQFFIVPFYGPRGNVLGFEGRALDGQKRITDFRTGDAKWTPVFVGLTATAMQKIWAGGDVWIVEGLFDMAALERVVPECDVVLATLRAKLSDAHVAFLGRFVKGTVHMVYDNDETGQKQMHGWVDAATGRHRRGALERLRWVGAEARAVSYRGGKDPGEIWDRGGQQALWDAFGLAIL